MALTRTKIQAKKCLLARENWMWLNRTVFVIIYKIKGFREKTGCVIVSTFLLFLFVYQLLLLDVFSDLHQKTTLADFRHKSLKSWKNR